MINRLATSNLQPFPRSIVKFAEMEYGLIRTQIGMQLAVLGSPGSRSFEAFDGKYSEIEAQTLLIGPLSACNAESLRNQLSWLRPKPLGLATSAGMGDRLGIATPGHVRAVNEVQGKIAPIFAQQSIREMNRT